MINDQTLVQDIYTQISKILKYPFDLRFKNVDLKNFVSQQGSKDSL